MSDLDTLLIRDIKTQISQNLYRSLSETADPLVAFIQSVASRDNLNWQLPEKKDRMARLFSNIGTAVSSYTLSDGDFRSYLILKIIEAVYTEYLPELVAKFVSSGYNATPEEVLAAIDSVYTLMPPQNTNFPDLENTATTANPMQNRPQLVPKSLYEL